jgi:membrane protein implicated in regulation of membrane protease activity
MHHYWIALALVVAIAGVLIGMEFMFLPFHWATYLFVGVLTIALFAFLFRRRSISRDPIDNAERHASDAEGITKFSKRDLKDK